MNKLLLATAALAAAMIAPSAALAVETATVVSGTLTYTSDAGQVDVVTVGDGTGFYYGRHFLTESASPSGTYGADCESLAPNPTVVCDGVTAFDVSALDRDDVVYVLSALPAKIDAGDGNDDVFGGLGPDTVDGGSGSDEIYTGAGDDRISARDGAKDTIDCGDGDDRADADDIDVVTNCETDPAPVAETPVVVDETPKVKGPPADAAPRAVEPEPPALPALPELLAASPVSLVAGPVQVGRDGLAPLELACAATEVAGCTGDVFLDPAPQGKAKGKGKGKAKGHGKAKGKGKVRALAARRGRFGRSPFQVAAGKKQNVKIKLSAEARNRLGLPKAKKARAARRGRRVKAKVTVVQRGKKPVAMVIELRG